MVWYGTIWYGVVWYDTLWYGMIWYGMVRHSMVWYGLVQYGMVWYGMGMVQYGMADRLSKSLAFCVRHTHLTASSRPQTEKILFSTNAFWKCIEH